jgi:hypothetical protein
MNSEMFKESIDKDGLPEPDPANLCLLNEKERAGLTPQKRGFCGFCGLAFYGQRKVCPECYERTMLL